MKNVILTIGKEAVYEEVARTTAYTGAKMEDESAYERMSTVDEDKEMLERFWQECKNIVCNNLKKMLLSETEADGAYSISLGLSSSFDEALTESMERSLFSFFVAGIAAKWFVFTNRKDAEVYAGEATSHLEDIMRKAFFKKRPVRPASGQSTGTCVIMEGNKKRLAVTMKVKELVYDIRNKSHLTGQAREGDGKKTYKAASNMQASDEEENSYQIRRSLTHAFSSLKSLLGEYLSEEQSTGDNLIRDETDHEGEGEGELELVFELPGNYNCASAGSLGEGIHDYLVDIVLGEWFTVTAPEEAQAYAAHSVVSLETVKRALYSRSRPRRPV